MRNKDREVTDRVEMIEILRACTCARVGFVDDGQVYLVPMNFGYAEEGGQDVFYFHTGKEGKKIELLEKCAKVGFEMDTAYELQESDKACNYSAYYRSVVGQGEMEILTKTEDKKHGLQVLMQHNTGKGEWEFEEKMVDAVAVLKLTAYTMTAKEHIKR